MQTKFSQGLRRVLGPLARRLRGSVERRRVARSRKNTPPDPDSRKLNLGAGRWHEPGWEVVDLYADPWFIDYRIDLRGEYTLPIASGCTELVFSSHTIEHMSDSSVRRLLAESYRVLRPGGVIRVATPNGERAVEAYQAGDHSFFDRGGVTCVGPSLERKLVNYFASYRDDNHSGGPIVDDQKVRDHIHLSVPAFAEWCASLIPATAPYVAHVNGFDATKLVSMFVDAGFSDAHESDYRASSVEELRGAAFDNRPRVSLFVEASKP